MCVKSTAANVRSHMHTFHGCKVILHSPWILFFQPRAHTQVRTGGRSGGENIRCRAHACSNIGSVPCGAAGVVRDGVGWDRGSGVDLGHS